MKKEKWVHKLPPTKVLLPLADTWYIFLRSSLLIIVKSSGMQLSKWAERSASESGDFN